MIFEILGDPIAQKRHRMTVRGKHPHAYDPCEKEKGILCGKIHEMAMSFYNDSKESAIEVSTLLNADYYTIDLEFHLSYPKTWRQKDINSYCWGLKVCDDNKDLDNLEKFFLDVCKEILITDDRYIVKLSSKKVYSTTPKTVIKIMAKKNPNLPTIERDILSLIPPDDLFKLRKVIYDMQSNVQDFIDVEELLNEGNEVNLEYRRQQLSETSALLSYLADHFGPVLTKIAKRYPGYWEEQFEKDSRFREFKDGKPIC